MVSIIDGNHMVNRCVFKGAHLTTANGELPTGGVFLFLKTLFPVKETYGHPVVVFDSGHADWRLKLFPGYKKRDEAPPGEERIAATIKTEIGEIKHTFDDVFKFTYNTLEILLPMLNIPVVKIDFQEADDIIARLVEIIPGKKTIISRDDDYLQLLSDEVDVYQPIKDKFYNSEIFEEEYKFSHKFIPLYKSLCGDGSDKIPNVPRIGEGTAAKIIRSLSVPSLNTLKEWAQSGDSSIQKNVLEHFESTVVRNYKLVDLSNIQLSKDSVEEAYNKAKANLCPDIQKVIKIFTYLEFKTLSNWIATLS